MNIVKREKNENYTTISNVFLRDKNLSIKAKGFLAVVMSLPEDWEFTINGICSVLKEGRTAIYSAIQELKDCGYCNVDICRDEKGLITGNDYTFREFPKKESQCLEEPHTENPNTGDNTQRSKEETNNGTDKIKKEEKEDKSSSKKKDSFPFRQALIDLGVRPEIVNDWLIVRKNKRASNTETAFNRIKNEILKSGKSANDCITLAVERSWQGFMAEWMLNEINKGNNQKPKPKTQEEINREKLTMPILNEEGDLPDGTFFKNGKRWYFSKQEGRAASCAPDASPRPNDRAEYDWTIKDWRVPRDKWEASDEIW